MTVEEFTLSYFTLGNKKIDMLHVCSNDGNGNQKNLYDGYIGSIIYMKPEVRHKQIKRWWVNTKANKIIVCCKEETK